MNRRRPWLCRALSLGLLGLAGCHTGGTQSCYQPAAPIVRSSGILPAHPLTPCQVCPVPSAPPAASLNPPAPIYSAGSAFQPLPAAPIQQAWGPAAAPGASLGEPVPTRPEQPRDSARLAVPESPEPPKTLPSDKPARPERSPTPKLPAGIANFAEALPGVASGLRPMLDGIAWLKTNGYRAALQIRQPDENADGDRRLFEQREIKYLSLQVSPATLTSEVVEQFGKIVSDPANRPLFVYDRDGTLAGGLWYLHFRTAEKLSDEEARKKAAPLGLKEDGEGAQREMWLAIQKYLADRKKQEESAAPKP